MPERKVVRVGHKPLKRPATGIVAIGFVLDAVVQIDGLTSICIGERVDNGNQALHADVEIIWTVRRRAGGRHIKSVVLDCQTRQDVRKRTCGKQSGWRGGWGPRQRTAV